MAAYFMDGHLHILSRVEQVTGRGQDAFILLGDFNMTPDEFEAQAGDWLKRNRAIIVKPSNLSITCRAGQEGSLIDFVVMSEKLAGTIRKCEADAEATWWPHYGVWLEVTSRPSRVKARTVEKHVIAEVEGSANAADPEGGNAQTDQRPSLGKKALWGMARKVVENGGLAARCRAYPGDHDETIGKAIRSYMEDCDTWEVAEDIGVRYAAWRQTALAYTNAAKVCGCNLLDDITGDVGRTEYTRVEEPRLEWFGSTPSRPPATPLITRKEVLERRDKNGAGGLYKHTVGGGGPLDARMWRTVRTWCTSIGKWSKRDNFGANHTAHHVIRLLDKFVKGGTQAARGTLSRVDPHKREELLAALTPLIAAAEMRAVVDFEIALGIIDDLHKKAIAKGYEHRRKDYADWLARALTGGAREAHKYVKKDLATPPYNL